MLFSTPQGESCVSIPNGLHVWPFVTKTRTLNIPFFTEFYCYCCLYFVFCLWILFSISLCIWCILISVYCVQIQTSCLEFVGIPKSEFWNVSVLKIFSFQIFRYSSITPFFSSRNCKLAYIKPFDTILKFIDLLHFLSLLSVLHFL